MIEHHKIDPSIPTLFICECVLSYINADKVDDLISYIRKQFNLAFLFDYEMYNPSDRFGQMMVKNFNERGCPLVGINKYASFNSQHERYQNAGWQRTEVYTMKDVYNECIDKSERMKI